MVGRIRGRSAARLVDRLQHAQLDLGLACSRTGPAAERDAEAARRRIRQLRVQLAHVGVVRAGTPQADTLQAGQRAAGQRAD
jgi:hypothetical protein